MTALGITLAKLKAASLIGAAVAGSLTMSAGHAEARTQAVTQSVVRVYIVRHGDTLFHIAAEFCGSGFAYPSLARASGIAHPNRIHAGQRIILACHSARPAPRPARIVTSGSSSANGQAAIPGTSIVRYSYYGLEQLWVAAGGSRAEEGTAACIAKAESGGNVYAAGRHGERGLWQIAPGWGSLSTYNPYGNARAAVIISRNGTNWRPWTTRRSCGA